MPIFIPILLAGASAISAAWGAKKGYDAKRNYSKAAEIVSTAETQFASARAELEEHREMTSVGLRNLGALRLEVENEQMARFVAVVRKVNSADYQPISSLGTHVELQLPSIEEIEVSAYTAADLLKDGVGAIAPGVLTGFGATGLVTTYGAASTGAAISSLAGAAATNATLAFLGGGSLAAGGFGVAGGAAVLGGAVTGPVLAVIGFAAARRSEVALTNATRREADLNVAVEQIGNAIGALLALRARTLEISRWITEISTRFALMLDDVDLLLAMKAREQESYEQELSRRREAHAKRAWWLKAWHLLCRKQFDFTVPDAFSFANFSETEQARYQMTVQTGFALYQLIKVRVLDDQGALTEESANAVATCEAMT